MTVSDTIRKPDKHISLTKGGVTVSFNLCNAQGIQDPLAIRQEQNPALGIKMHQGGTKHSDYVPPYATLEQRDWSGGRGLDDMDLDESRYFDSKAAHTWNEGKILMGPQYKYGKGYRNSDTNMWDAETGDYAYLSMYGTTKGFSASFTADASYNAARISVVLVKYGSPGEATIAIRSDAAGVPDTLVSATTATLSEEGIPTQVTAVIDGAITDTNVFHICVSNEGAAWDADNRYDVLAGTLSGCNRQTLDDNWSTNTQGPYFRITDAHNPFKAFFFQYAEVPHVVVDYEDKTIAPKIFINGDMGRLTTAAGTGSGYLQDSTKSWVTDQWVGAKVIIYSGTGSGDATRYRTIISNTATALMFKFPWDQPLDTSSVYCIIDTDIWQEITGHNLRAHHPITDAISVGSLAYIARGDYLPILEMRYPSLLTGEFKNVTGYGGTFLEVATDSNGDLKLWMATRSVQDGSTSHIERSDIPYGDRRSTFGEIDWGYTVSITNADMELDSSWSSVGSVVTNERSSTVAHNATYSRHIVADDDNEGIRQEITGLIIGSTYKLSGWAYMASGATVTNGDMELDSDWSSVGTPTTNERSDAESMGGTYSRHIVADADNEGVTQSITGLTIGTEYHFSCWVKIPAASANGVTFEFGGTVLDSTSVKDTWTFLSGSFTATATSHNLQILSAGGAAEFYADDVASGSPNGCKMKFGGTELDAVELGSYGTWVRLSGNFVATAVSHYLEFLSDGGAAEFYIDNTEIQKQKTGLQDALYEKITGLIAYGEPERLFVATTGGLYMESNGKFVAIPIRDMRYAADERNGKALAVHDVYLFLSFHDGLERYYKSNLDDMGPDREEGLPEGRRGNFSDLVVYPGRMYGAYDGGDTGVSSVLMYNNFGWHEVWRAPITSTITGSRRLLGKGSRIDSLYVQATPGSDVDKLWISCDGDFIWVPIDLNPQNNDSYRYTYSSTLEMQTIYYGKQDVEKHWAKVKVIAENLSAASGNRVFVDYRVDGDTAWIQVGEYDTSPFESHNIVDSSGDKVSGRSIKLRLRMETGSALSTPEIKAVALDFIEQNPVRNSWSMTFLAEDNNITLQGVPAYDRVETGLSYLETWRDSPTPAAMGAWSSMVNGKNVKIVYLAPSFVLVDPLSQKEKLVYTMTVIETD